MIKEEAGTGREMIRHFHLEGLEKRLPRGFPVVSNRELHWRGLWHMSRPSSFLMNRFSALDVFLKDRLQQEMMELLSDYDGTVILVSHSRG